MPPLWPHLRAHVVGCTDDSGGQVHRGVEGTRDAKVPQLDVAVTGEEDVLGLEVAVQDGLLVDVPEGVGWGGEGRDGGVLDGLMVLKGDGRGEQSGGREERGGTWEGGGRGRRRGGGTGEVPMN